MTLTAVPPVPALDVPTPTPDSALDDEFDLLTATPADLVAEAEALLEAGRFDAAATAWRRAARGATATLDYELAVQSSLSAARCALETSDVEAATGDVDSALAAAMAACEPGLTAEVSELRGELHARAGDGAETERWLRAAVAGYEAARRPLDGARVRMTLGEHLGSAGRPEEATEAFAAARHVFRTHGCGMDASWCDDRLAAALIDLGRLTEALDHLHAAARVAEATGDTARIAYAQYRLGWTFVLAGRGTDSFPSLRRARELYAELGDLVGGANCDAKAAQVHTEIGDHATAVDLYERAIAVFDAFGADRSARTAEDDLAEVFDRMHRYEEAVSRRFALLDRLPTGDNYLRAAVSVRLAEDLVRLDEAPRALAVLEDAGAYHEGCDNRLEYAHYRAARARALLAANSVSSAREEAEELLRSVDGEAFAGVRAKALEVVSECMRLTMQTAASERYLVQAVALYLSIGEHHKAAELSRGLLSDRAVPATARPERPSVFGAVYL